MGPDVPKERNPHRAIKGKGKGGREKETRAVGRGLYHKSQPTQYIVVLTI